MYSSNFNKRLDSLYDNDSYIVDNNIIYKNLNLSKPSYYNLLKNSIDVIHDNTKFEINKIIGNALYIENNDMAHVLSIDYINNNVFTNKILKQNNFFKFTILSNNIEIMWSSYNGSILINNSNTIEIIHTGKPLSSVELYQDTIIETDNNDYILFSKYYNKTIRFYIENNLFKYEITIIDNIGKIISYCGHNDSNSLYIFILTSSSILYYNKDTHVIDYNIDHHNISRIFNFNNTVFFIGNNNALGIVTADKNLNYINNDSYFIINYTVSEKEKVIIFDDGRYSNIGDAAIYQVNESNTLIKLPIDLPYYDINSNDIHFCGVHKTSDEIYFIPKNYNEMFSINLYTLNHAVIVSNVSFNEFKFNSVYNKLFLFPLGNNDLVTYSINNKYLGRYNITSNNTSENAFSIIISTPDYYWCIPGPESNNNIIGILLLDSSITTINNIPYGNFNKAIVSGGNIYLISQGIGSVYKLFDEHSIGWQVVPITEEIDGSDDYTYISVKNDAGTIKNHFFISFIWRVYNKYSRRYSKLFREMQYIVH